METNEYIIHGIPPHAPLEDGTAGKCLYNILQKHKNIKLYTTSAETGKSISYKDLLERSCRLAQSFLNHGYSIDTLISICSENDINFMHVVIAGLFVGLTIAPINPNYTERELLQSYNKTKPKVVFCSNRVLHKILQLKENMLFIEKVVIIDMEEDTPNAESLNKFIERGCNVNFNVDNFQTVEFDRDQHVSVILPSSGTTGVPKQVMLTDRNVVVRFNHCRHPLIGTGLHIKPGGSVISITPLFHAIGFFTTLCYVILGLHIVQMRRFKEELFLASIEKYKCDNALIVPTIVIILIKSPLVDRYDLSSLTEIGCGGASLPKDAVIAVKKRLHLKNVRQGYGLTEVTLLACFTPPNCNKPASVGKLLPFAYAKIFDIESRQSLGPNQLGEICIKGTIIMKGYFNDEEATKDAIDEHGWLHTGDVGYYDEDEYFYVVDRIKEIIKYKSFQVAPAQLEALLLEHPHIEEVAILGKPDLVAGELPIAFIVVKSEKTITEQDVHNFLEGKISSEKRLRGGVRFVEALPKSSVGKILKKDLRLLLQQEFIH